MTNEELVKLIQNNVNVSENMELLYEQNRGFIYKTVSKRTNTINDENDLMQQAYFGLYNAALKYNQEEMECSFISILKFYILNSIRDNGNFTARMNYYVYKYKKIRNDYHQKYDCYPDDDYMCKVLKVGIKGLNYIKQCATTSMLSLNTFIGEEDNTELGDIIPDESIEDFDDIVEREDLKRIVNRALFKLSNREEHILRELYYKNRTLESVGNDTGIGRERVRQLKERGLRNLRKDTQFVKATEDYRSYIPMRHIGLNEFKRTGTSEVEWSVLEMERIRTDKAIERYLKEFEIYNKYCDKGESNEYVNR